MMNKRLQTLPPIPEKRYFSIGETSELCAVKPHVLRYWEQEFSQLKPTTRTGGRRYYQVKDVQLVRQIRTLLYEKGFTIAGAKKQLKSPKNNSEKLVELNVSAEQQKESPLSMLITELEFVLEQITS